jgi:hypothetical protein
MFVKRLAAAVAIVTGVGLSGLNFGVEVAHAVPLDPPSPSPTSAPDPGGPAMKGPTGPPPTGSVPSNGPAAKGGQPSTGG